MARFRGIPVYTQHSVAFPMLTLPSPIVEELNVSFQAKGGGTHGEFTFEWASLGSRSFGRFGRETEPVVAIRVKAFSDGFGAMLDDRIVEVLTKLKRMREKDRDVAPEKLIEMLEAVGVRRSIYHMRGMLDHGEVPYEERAGLQKEIERLRKHEEGS
jgi:hypothetical protein